jgi:hypothetical protein
MLSFSPLLSFPFLYYVFLVNILSFPLDNVYILSTEKKLSGMPSFMLFKHAVVAAVTAAAADVADLW